MIAVDKVNVSVSGRSEEHRVSGGEAAEGVSGRIVFAEIGFDFDYAGGEADAASDLPGEYFPQEFAGYAARIAGVEGASEGMDPSGGRNLRLRHVQES